MSIGSLIRRACATVVYVVLTLPILLLAIVQVGADWLSAALDRRCDSWAWVERWVGFAMRVADRVKGRN